MAVDVLLGLQWGDEGKGKVVDFLAENYDLVCRFQGGPNAGHTIVIGSNKYVLHTIPSGIFRKHIINVIGNGVVIDPITMVKELDRLDGADINYSENLLVAKKAHLIIPTHRWLDAASEASKGKQKIGSTLKGIGPTYMDKTGRNGLRIGDLFQQNFREKYDALKKKHLGILGGLPDVDFNLEEEEKIWFEGIERLKEIPTINCEYYINNALKEGKKILAEGAQGSMLDIDFGTYPFVTSSNTITAGVCTGLGISPQKIGEVIGIAKAYCTRVGSGPFPTELHDETGEKLRKLGHEFGATTGRPRRCGWNDIPQLKYTIMLNGVTQIALTKLDVLDEFETIEVGRTYDVYGDPSEELPYDLNTEGTSINYEEIPGWNTSLDEVTSYEELPDKAREYVEFLEEILDTRISMVSTGPERRKLLQRK